MPEPTDTTRERILAAAIQEFAAQGRSGTRVDAIARRAGCNKQLLYHYFGNKDALYEAVTMAALAQRPPPAISTPDDLGRAIDHVLDHQGEMAEWWRLSLWESLETGTDGVIVGEEQRRAKMQRSVDEIAHAQQIGLLDPSIPTRYLLLALMGMLVLPFVMPQLVRLLCRCSPSDESFKREYRTVLLDVVARLRPPP